MSSPARATALAAALAASLAAAGCRGPSLEERAARLMDDGKAQLARQTPDGKRAALATYRAALELWDRAGDHRRAAEAAGQLGEVYDNLGDMPAAEAWSAQALERYRRAGDAHGEVMAMSWIGIAEVHQGKVEPAIARFREGLARARARGDREAEGYSLMNLAFGLQRSERPTAVAEALAANEEALPVYTALGDEEQLSTVHNNLGRAALLLGDAPRALHHHRAALEIRTRRDLRLHLPWSYLNLAEVHLDLLGEPAAALDLNQRALSLSLSTENRLVEPYARYGLGAALLALERPAEALPHLEQALAGWRTQGPDRAPSTAIALGEAQLALGRTADAARTFDGVLADPAAGGHPIRRAAAELGRARLARLRGDEAAAGAAAEAAIAQLEAARASLVRDEHRATFLATMRGAFELAIEVQYAGGDPDAAFRTAERGRARHLFEALARAGGASPAAARPLGAREAQALLDPDTALVAFHLGERAGLAWAIAPERIVVAPLPPRAQLEARAVRLHQLLGERDRAVAGEGAPARRARLAAADVEVERELAALSRVLLGPLAGALTARRLAVIPDGALGVVPLAALSDPRTGRLLVEDHELVQVPSAAVLDELRRRRPAQRGGRVAVLADPVFAPDDPRLPRAAAAAVVPPVPPGPSFARLPHTRDEAEAISALVPAADRAIALDAAADRARLFGPEVAAADIVHIASHALVDAVRPERSALVLSLFDAAGRPSPGRVGLAELSGLSLRADLVTLSACATALGKEIRGEGMLSLTRGFLTAGARRVLATQWTVDDRATAELMRRFYRGLLADRLPASAALQRAQRELATDPRWRARYYWAGVALYGDWR